MYLHFVWATRGRVPVVIGETEQKTYACIRSEIEKAHCELLALGGMPDHVHAAVRMSSALSPAVLAQRMKGVSALVANREIGPGTLAWQDGYGVFSFSRSHLARVVAYIREQRRHHTEQALWGPWESVAVPEP